MKGNSLKIFLLANFIIISLILAGDVCYILYGGLWLKSITSAGFVLLGIVNLLYAIKNKKNLKFAITMLIGLTFAMCGDIVLNVWFIGGAVLFAVGHVFYFIAYCFLQKFKLLDLIVGAVIFVPSVLFITLAPIFDFGGIIMELVCIIYAIIISIMLGKAISNFIRERNLTNLLILIGSALFFFSDLMLLLNVFANLSVVFDVLCLATYYPAECLLALSLMQIEKK